MGNPIPGSTKEDIWTGCYISAPSNFSADVQGNNDVLVSWDKVDLEDGFDPEKDTGFYQIEIGGSDPWTPDLYGSNHIKSTNHIVPWAFFSPGSPGFPDGTDLGIALEDFPDGIFSIRIEAFSEPPAGSGGYVHECVVVDFDENLSFEKEGESVTILD